MADNLYQKLLAIQGELKCNKSQYNSFGKYSYRSCEDILEAVKSLLVKYQATIIITDEIKLIGDRYYVEAKVKFIDVVSGQFIENSALAREDEQVKGMSASQITGSTSSYARKYALGALLLLDDVKDADATNTHEKENITNNSNANSYTSNTRKLSDKQLARLYTIANKAGVNKDLVKQQVMKKFNKEPKDLTKPEYDIVCSGYEKAAEKTA